MTARNIIDMTGRRCGRLVVRGLADVHGEARWTCDCDCGASCVARGYLLRDGTTRSCGCLRREVAAARQLKHGANRRGACTPEANTWSKMIARCENPRDSSFVYYGARGIRVCEEWRHDFAAFLAHIGPRPSDKHSVDRIDNERGYEPGNVRWATLTEQARNRRSNSHLTAFGETLTIAEWAERTGLHRGTIGSRIGYGMSPEKALSAGDLRTKGRHAPRATPRRFVYSQARTSAA